MDITVKSLSLESKFYGCVFLKKIVKLKHEASIFGVYLIMAWEYGKSQALLDVNKIKRAVVR